MAEITFKLHEEGALWCQVVIASLAQKPAGQDTGAEYEYIFDRADTAVKAYRERLAEPEKPQRPTFAGDSH